MSTPEPVQLAEEARTETWLDQARGPIYRLWLRVWWRAVCDYVLYKSSTNRRRRRLANDASEWLFGDECGCEGECLEMRLSFRHFCDLFGADQAAVRLWVVTLTRDDIGQLGRGL